ncbi:MAG TPA: dockerin type I domain-containing protein [Phycisphaerae bacterium]
MTGQKLQYQSLPGDVNLDGTSNTVDLLALVTALNNGSANLSDNLARYNIDRMGGVNTQDLLRLVQLLNGVNTTQVFNGATVAPCPN